MATGTKSLLDQPICSETASKAVNSVMDELRMQGKRCPTISAPQFSTLMHPHLLSEEYVAFLRESGYRVVEFDGDFMWGDILAGLRTYHKAHGSINRMPPNFVVTDDVIAAGLGYRPDHLGMRLGAALQSLRVGDVDGYDDIMRRKVLETLGFRWSDEDLRLHLRFRYKPLILGLRIYATLYSCASPRRSFVVPADEPIWPNWMVGMPLGEWAAAARAQRSLIEEHYPSRFQILHGLDFFWDMP